MLAQKGTKKAPEPSFRTSFIPPGFLGVFAFPGLSTGNYMMLPTATAVFHPRKEASQDPLHGVLYKRYSRLSNIEYLLRGLDFYLTFTFKFCLFASAAYECCRGSGVSPHKYILATSSMEGVGDGWPGTIDIQGFSLLGYCQRGYVMVTTLRMPFIFSFPPPILINLIILSRFFGNIK